MQNCQEWQHVCTIGDGVGDVIMGDGLKSWDLLQGWLSHTQMKTLLLFMNSFKIPIVLVVIQST